MTAFTIAPDGTEVIYSTCRYPDPDAAARRAAEGERVEEEDYKYELARVRIDGTEHRRLTENRILDNHPTWSPDGRRIAFLAGGSLSHRAYEVVAHLYTMAPDGSDRQQLQTGLFGGIILKPPQWSPDGGHLAFVKRDGNRVHIYTHATGDTKSQRLTDTVSGPSWSPDGQRIAFAKPDGAEVALYTIAADGTDPQRVATIDGWRRAVEEQDEFVMRGEPHPRAAWIETVAWSPSGEHILYTCYPAICVVDLEGRLVGQAPLAPVSRSNRRVQDRLVAAWAPDGSRIALVSKGASYLNYGHALVLYSMKLDGTSLRLLAEWGAEGELDIPNPQRQAAFRQSPPPRSAAILVDVAGCAAGTAVPEPATNPGLVDDCKTLLKLRDALGGTLKLNWSGDRPLAEWTGVVVGGSPARVHELTILRRALTGSVPPGLGELTHLRVLNLSWNKLEGPIPPELGNLEQLVILRLSENRLSGRIPPELGALSRLTELWLDGNQLDGPIPAELGALSQLQVLSFTFNDLTGAIPPEFGQLTNLRKLELNVNELTGPIPAELAQLVNVTELRLNGNPWTGCVPPKVPITNRMHLTDRDGVSLPDCEPG